jgi:putative ABC transport system permease protein
MGTLAQDLKHGARLLRASPGATAAAVMALALGIGGCTAIFSVVHAVLLRPLPYERPEQILHVWASAPSRQLDFGPLSYQRVQQIEKSNQSFEAFGAYTIDSVDLTGVSEPRQLKAARVSSGVLKVLGVPPVKGRSFLPEEDAPGAASVAMLSHHLWRDQFGSDPQIVGKGITLGGVSATVVGIMPAGFAYPEPDVAIYVSRIFEPNFLTSGAIERGSSYLDAIARPRSGVGRAAVQADLDRLSASDKRSAFLDADLNYQIVPLMEHVTGNVRPTLLIFSCAVGFVLLIACANVANVLLARAVDRRREVAVRAALGASRARIFRQFLAESLLLALPAGVLGVLVAFWGARIFSTAAAQSIPRAGEINLDVSVLLVTCLFTLLTALLAGLAPAFHASHADPSATLSDARAHSSSGRRGGRTRSALIVLEVALSVVLLVGAGLLMKSFSLLQGVQPGFATQNLVVAKVNLPSGRYADAARIRDFQDRVAEALATLPGVISVGAGETLPPDGSGKTPLAIDGGPAKPIGERDLVAFDTVTLGYFRTLGIPVLAGRTFTNDDKAGSPIKVVVSRAFARQYFPNDSPIGKGVLLGRGTTGYEIVGEVGDVKQDGLDSTPAAFFYLTANQRPIRSFSLVIRTNGPMPGLAALLRARVAEVDRDQAIGAVETMHQTFARSLAPRRFILGVIGIFAVLAVALAAIGVYGVLSYAVSRRTPEIGVRMALGAQRWDVMSLVMRESFVLAILGVGIGLAAAFALTRLMARLLFGVSPTDPWIFAEMAAIVVVVALLASYGPASRATRVDPVGALKTE